MNDLNTPSSPPEPPTSAAGLSPAASAARAAVDTAANDAAQAVRGTPASADLGMPYATSEASPAVADAADWIPVRTLQERHRPRMAAHLRSLPPQDRYLRFGQVATDEFLDRYVASIDFSSDQVLGIFNRRLDLVAVAHLAYPRASEGRPRPTAAEFGVSVDARLRGRRLGSRLFDCAILHARNRGVNTLLVHALTENGPMLRMARAAGATIERDGPDSLARLTLPAQSVGSQIQAWVEDGAAELAYSHTRHARQFDRFLQTLREGFAEHL